MGAVTGFIPQKIKYGTRKLTDVLRTALDRINDKRIIIGIYLKDLRVDDEKKEKLQQLAFCLKFLSWKFLSSSKIPIAKWIKGSDNRWNESESKATSTNLTVWNVQNHGVCQWIFVPRWSLHTVLSILITESCCSTTLN